MEIEKSFEETLGEVLEEALIELKLDRVIKKIVCVVCEEEYKYFIDNYYPGKSLERCPTCQMRYEDTKQMIVIGTSKRHMGHNTRQQHKKV